MSEAKSAADHAVAPSEQRRDEEALRIQAELLKLSLDAILSWRVDGGIESWNVGAERLYGIPEVEALGRVSYQLLATEFPKPWDEFRADLIETGFWEGELAQCTRDGSRIFVSARFQLIQGFDGVQRVLETARDITERKRAEEALRAGKERNRFLAGLLEKTDQPFAIGHRDGTLGYVNSAYERLTGYSRDELKRADWARAMTPPEWRELERVKLEELSRTGQPVRYEKECIRKDGTRVPIELVVDLSKGGQGEPFYYSFITDLTERKRAEEALQEREREFRELAESMPQFVWVTDANGMALFLNHRWEEQLGVSVEQMLGEGWARILHPDDRERVLNLWYRCASTGEHYETEYRFRTVNGEYRYFLARGVPIRDEQGRIRRWFGTCTDIEDTKRSEERLRQSQKLESVGLLAGGIAHDFNNILTGIMGNASLLLEDAEPERAEMLRSIIAGTERAAHLTRQLLAYSGKGQFIVRELDVTQAVNEMADLVQFSIPKSVSLALTLERRLPFVTMDPGQLQQILMNLVINAGEAIGNGNPGRITVTTSMADVQSPFTDELGEEIAPGRYVCVEVRDTGSGIDPEKKARIFDPFFTTKFVGRGLGLAAIAGILRSQKGGIIVESTPSEGSTFRVFLPAAGRAGLVNQEPRSQDGRPAILVVDDEVAVRDFISAVLRRKGYQVVQASDGQEALAVVGSVPGDVDAAIVDIIMPNMSANDLLPALKAKQPGMRILLTSGYSEAEARRLCAAYPGAAFIQKPYTAEQLATAVGELVGASAFRRTGRRSNLRHRRRP